MHIKEEKEGSKKREMGEKERERVRERVRESEKE